MQSNQNNSIPMHPKFIALKYNDVVAKNKIYKETFDKQLESERHSPYRPHGIIPTLYSPVDGIEGETDHLPPRASIVATRGWEVSSLFVELFMS